MSARQPEPREARTPLDHAQLAALQQAMRERENTIIRGVLQQPDYPPLPACPECGAAAQRIDSMVEPPAFGQKEDALLINFVPCGHRFRAVVDELATATEARRGGLVAFVRACLQWNERLFAAIQRAIPGDPWMLSGAIAAVWFVALYMAGQETAAWVTAGVSVCVSAVRVVIDR